MEIERKFLVNHLPDLSSASHVKHLEQGYISTKPVIRIRQSNDNYTLTCKGKGLLAREEFELPIDKESYLHLKTKLDYPMIKKTRYLISYNNYTIELDLFLGQLDGLILAEVEFSSIEEANDFMPPKWFGKDVTSNPNYQNSCLTTLHDYGSSTLANDDRAPYIPYSREQG